MVFIHIPKTGGTSIRSVFDDRPTSTAQGIVPAAWGCPTVFAVVRNPIDRFLSGFNMFKHGTPDVTGYYSTPRLPDFTIREAIDVLYNPDVPYDRSARNDLANFKHHIWPQTAAFHCLSRATHLLRFETLEQDAAALFDQIGLAKKLPHLRVTTGNPRRHKSEDLDAKDLDALEHFYARDFALLGYEGVSDFSLDDSSFQESDALLSVWRVYFENVVSNELGGSEALPHPSVNLALFSDNRIDGLPKKTWPGRQKNLLEHFRNLEGEFSGRLRISHLLACTIVVLRRDLNNREARELFFRLIESHGKLLAKDLNLRWLTSVCDTLVDIGKTDFDRAIALNGTTVSGLIKLAETERRLFTPPSKWPPKVRYSRGGMLFDGVISFWTEKGDMIDNLLDRMSSVLETDSAATPFVSQLIERIVAEDTVLTRLSALHGRKIPLQQGS